MVHDGARRKVHVRYMLPLGSDGGWGQGDSGAEWQRSRPGGQGCLAASIHRPIVALHMHCDLGDHGADWGVDLHVLHAGLGTGEVRMTRKGV